MSSIRIIRWTLSIAAVILLLGAAVASGVLHKGGGSATVLHQIGGPFELTSEYGERFASSSLAGRPFAIYFGFTLCPDVCPTSMFEMAKLLEEVGRPAADFTVLFVTVDPERDTPELLRAYTDSFDPRIVGLTGSAQEIAGVAKAYRAFYQKVPTSSGDYTMDHSTLIYLMDAQGRFVTGLSHQEDHASKVQKLRRLLAGG